MRGRTFLRRRKEDGGTGHLSMTSFNRKVRPSRVTVSAWCTSRSRDAMHELKRVHRVLGHGNGAPVLRTARQVRAAEFARVKVHAR